MGRLADPDRRRDRVAAVGACTADDRGAKTRARPSACAYAAVLPPPPYGITNASGAPPSSSTISYTAVFCPSRRYGLSELTSAYVPSAASSRAASSASSKSPRTASTRAPCIRSWATFAPRHGARGREHDCGQPGARRVRRRRRGGVARRGADHRAGALLQRLRDRNGHAAVLVRGGRVRRLPLGPQLGAVPLRQARQAQAAVVDPSPSEIDRRAFADRKHRPEALDQGSGIVGASFSAGRRTRCALRPAQLLDAALGHHGQCARVPARLGEWRGSPRAPPAPARRPPRA